MSSKLFHTVVAFGITLGAAACSAEPVDTSSSSEDAIVTAEEPAAPAPVKAEPKAEPVKEKDRFCEVPWPTTKGGPRPAESQDCIDPQTACGEYPGVNVIGHSRETCYPVDAANVCDGTKPDLWMFCKVTGTSAEWACPTGTQKVAACTWPPVAEDGNSDGDNAPGPQAKY